MNRRADDRIEMKLPCHLLFPSFWQASVPGFTTNLHRNGALVACDLNTYSREVPIVGEKASLSIILPVNHCFHQKCIDCESVLMRARQTEPGQWLFALRFENVSFAEFGEEKIDLTDLNEDSGGYIV